MEESNSNSNGKEKRAVLQTEIRNQLSKKETERILSLCGKFLYSSITKGAIVTKADGTTFVATGDIDDMWTRDSSVQISLYYNRHQKNRADTTNFRAIVEGTLRKNAFYIVQDPYANAYESSYKDPLQDWPNQKDRVIGRGGWVATRNYELDSGAYFLNQLWDYFVSDPAAAARVFLQDAFILDAVRVLVDVWGIEQDHDNNSDYRYFELANEGKGTPSARTGLTWTGFRPSDDPCVYHYLIPANIHAAAGLERVLVLNHAMWKDPALHSATETLLKEISEGIRRFGIVKADDDGSLIYAYEVDGTGNALKDYDDANVPSLLSIPLLGWTGYDRDVYANTRKRLLSNKNKFYYKGSVASGIGSKHTRKDMIWPMALAIQGMTAPLQGDGNDNGNGNSATEIVTKLRELLKVSECKQAMHESIHKDIGCKSRSREWFEWANALFVVLVESSLGETCDRYGQNQVRYKVAQNATKGRFYSNRYNNTPDDLHHYQGIQAFLKHD